MSNIWRACALASLSPTHSVQKMEGWMSISLNPADYPASVQLFFKKGVVVYTKWNSPEWSGIPFWKSLARTMFDEIAVFGAHKILESNIPFRTSWNVSPDVIYPVPLTKNGCEYPTIPTSMVVPYHIVVDLAKPMTDNVRRDLAYDVWKRTRGVERDEPCFFGLFSRKTVEYPPISYMPWPLPPHSKME